MVWAHLCTAAPIPASSGKTQNRHRLNRSGDATVIQPPGVFAAGDVRHGSVERVASAVGEGSIAIYLVHEHLRHL